METALLDLDEAEQAIRRCNGSTEFRAADRLMHTHFPSPEAALDAASIAERVVLINGVWATQMFWKQGLAERVIGTLRSGADRFLEVCRSLDPAALETSPARVVEAARVAMPIALGLTDADGSGGPYSFATKFLHWTTRCHFPIMDSRARAAINCLQRARDMEPRVPQSTGDLPWQEDYPRWIAFYSQLIGSLAPRDRERLMRADRDSQPEPDPCENSLLRVLDKAFYALGSAPDESAAIPPGE